MLKLGEDAAKQEGFSFLFGGGGILGELRSYLHKYSERHLHLGWTEIFFFPQIEKQRWTLKLDTVFHDDKGNYTCVISNHYGQIRWTFILDIVSKYIRTHFELK